MLNNSSRLSRRQLLQYSVGLGVTGGLVPRCIASSPDTPRIAALDWTGVELIDGVGLTPIAVSDIANYRQWVVTPSLPATTLELGLRNEPNLEVLAALRPDYMIVPQYLAVADSQLQQFGLVLRYPFTQPHRKILSVAHDNLLDFGRQLQRETFAQQTISRWHSEMTAARQQLQHWQGKRLLMYSFLSARQVLVMTSSSLFGEVLTMMDIDCAWQGSANLWGSAVVGIEQLYPLKVDVAIEFLHGESGNSQTANHSGLWEKMPFRQHAQYFQVDGTWMYGGLHAALRFTYQLLRLAEHSDD